VLVYAFKEPFVSIFTPNQEVKEKTLSIIWLIVFQLFPDGYKGMLKGIIKALGI